MSLLTMMLAMLYGSFSLTGTWTKFAMLTSCQISNSQGLIIHNRLNAVHILWLNHRDIKHPRAGGAERTIMELSKRLYPKNIHLTLVTGGYISNNANENDQKYELYRFRGNLGPHIASPHFLKQNYDVSLLIHLKNDGARLAEVPAFYRHGKGSKFNSFFLTLGMFAALAAYTVRYSRLYSITPEFFVRAYFRLFRWL